MSEVTIIPGPQEVHEITVTPQVEEASVVIQPLVEVSEIEVINQSSPSELVITPQVVMSEVVISTPTVVLGGMDELIYDPNGVKSDVFNAGNLYGNIDGGTFN